jgi:hypothetical protein
MDDRLVATQNMVGNSHVVVLEPKHRAWEEIFGLVRTTIGSWLHCQISWMYLEPIFASSDIQKQLPSESTRFQEVDTMWKTVMSRVTKTPRPPPNRVSAAPCRSRRLRPPSQPHHSSLRPPPNRVSSAPCPSRCLPPPPQHRHSSPPSPARSVPPTPQSYPLSKFIPLKFFIFVIHLSVFLPSDIQLFATYSLQVGFL